MLLLYPIESVALTIVFRRLSPNIVCQVEKTVVMKAFGIINASAGGGIDMLMEFPLPVPQLRPRDILVAVDASGVNQVDCKARAGSIPVERDHWYPVKLPKVLGYSGAGVVEALGSAATLFSVGDAVFFAGCITRDGTNATFCAVDERVVGHAPTKFSATLSAGMPLTVLTAYEGLEQLGLRLACKDDESCGN